MIVNGRTSAAVEAALGRPYRVGFAKNPNPTLPDPNGSAFSSQNPPRPDPFRSLDTLIFSALDEISLNLFLAVINIKGIFYAIISPFKIISDPSEGR